MTEEVPISINIHTMGSIDNEWATEPIAIIGLSCKFAGDASNAEGLWNMLAEGRNAWSEVPSSRFNPKGAYNPNSEKLSTVNYIPLLQSKVQG
jgi:acyl transferase domain-containing protein